MPLVMLKRTWPGNFRRTITTKVRGKEIKRAMEFTPGVAVDLSSAEIEAIRSDIGVCLMPVELDEKARPRIITDDVIPSEMDEHDESRTVS